MSSATSQNGSRAENHRPIADNRLAVQAMLKRHRRINFDRVNRAALAALPRLLERWLPGRRAEGAEYLARNPRRTDNRPGSFKINMRTGRWADFATGDRGGDPVSLVAFLAEIGQAEAARRLAAILELSEANHARR